MHGVDCKNEVSLSQIPELIVAQYVQHASVINECLYNIADACWHSLRIECVRLFEYFLNFYIQPRNAKFRIRGDSTLEFQQLRSV